MPLVKTLKFKPWKVKNSKGTIDIPATVPGEVHTDLIRAGHIQDPYFRDNYIKYRWIAKEDWIYSTSFSLNEESKTNDPKQLQHKLSKKYYLIAEGLDTVGHVHINGQTVLQFENQFRQYIQDITTFLEPTGTENTNELSVYFKNSVNYAEEKAKSYPYVVPDGFAEEQHGEQNRNFIRKEQCSFSWDWGPCFAPCGIWKSFKIVQLDEPSLFVVDCSPLVSWSDTEFIVDIHFLLLHHGFTNHHHEHESSCKVNVVAKVAGFEFVSELTLLKAQREYKVTVNIPKDRVSLWWCNGLGTPTLYDLTCTFYSQPRDSANPKIHKHENSNEKINIQSETTVMAQVTRKIGFREIRLIQNPYPDQPGTSFYFELNGIPVFAKGCNWIPTDVFESRVTRSKLEQLLGSCVEANMNMIRVWGGGIYQQDAFYEICDRLGLMVWQEFMFACAMYPTDTKFLNNVKQEAFDQVFRLMKHSSIVLWSGNNENEEALITGWYEPTKKNPFLYAVDYHRLYHETIKPVVEFWDKTRAYISSSPYNGVISTEPFTERYVAEGNNNDLYGDVHYYNYKDNGLDISKYKKPRFMSEYGFQSMPSWLSMQHIIQKEDMHPLSAHLKFRNHHKFGQEEILHQINLHFTTKYDSWPENQPISVQDFKLYCYLSQVSQAICVKAQTEQYRLLRSQKPNCMGALYWQCNDIWQAPTWAGMEYDGRWKVLHYFAKNFFEHVHPSAYLDEGFLKVYVTNDEPNDFKGSLLLEFWKTNESKPHCKLEIPCKVPSNKDDLIFHQNLSHVLNDYGLNEHNCVISIHCLGSSTALSTAELANGQRNDVKGETWFVPDTKSVCGQVDPQLELVAVEIIDFCRELDDRKDQKSATFYSTTSSTYHSSPIKSEKSSHESRKIVKLTLKCQFVSLFTWIETTIRGHFSWNGGMLYPNETKEVYFYPYDSFDETDNGNVNETSYEFTLKDFDLFSVYDATRQDSLPTSCGSSSPNNNWVII